MLLLLLFIVQLTNAISGQTTTTTGCVDGFYGPWINENHPTLQNRNDTEMAPNTTVLDQICDPMKGTLMVHCRDSSGEPFVGTLAADSANHFTKSCTISHGLTCRITEANTTCPDFSIQYGCNCSAPQTGTTPQCTDDPVFDCQRFSTLFNICSDVQNAKAVCRNTCGLCDLVDGGWADWAAWSACDVTCSNGTIHRSRTCTNPSPVHGGSDCVGSNQQNSGCHLQDCPIAGGWSVWSPWGSCSVSCGVGLQRRDRSCSNPYPQRYGDHCFGDDKIYKSCFDRSCSDGAWSSWSSWDTCTATCNGGLQSRTRSCTNPAPTEFGQNCLGTDVDKQLCNTRNCPEKKVAFSVYTPHTALTSDSTPTFRTSILNTGSYNMATGKFTCPVAGIYSFSLTLRHDGTDTGNVHCWFRVNGTKKSYVNAYNDAYEQASGAMIVALNVADVVDIQCNEWGHAENSSGTTFSGVLITPS